jgi:hypothetical protein
LGWYNGWYNDKEGDAMALTVKELEALNPMDKGRILTDGGSLKGHVYVSLEGRVTVHFRFAYKFKKSSKTIAVGTYPSLTLAQIRRSRDALRAQIVEARKTNALDPIGQRRKNSEDATEALKVEDLRKAAEREAELLKIEADRQEKLLLQQNRLQSLAAQQARVSVREMFDLWKRLDLVSRADKGEEAERSFKRDVFPMIGVEGPYVRHVHKVEHHLLFSTTAKSQNLTLCPHSIQIKCCSSDERNIALLICTGESVTI